MHLVFYLDLALDCIVDILCNAKVCIDILLYCPIILCQEVFEFELQM